LEINTATGRAHIGHLLKPVYGVD